MKRLFLIICLVILGSYAHADDMLMGRYWADDSACFQPANSMVAWKLARYQAEASGEVDYLTLHIPSLNNVGGANSVENCTADTVCVVVYTSVATGSDPPNPGTEVASGCTENYNWETIGINNYHTFSFDSGGSVTAGSYYFIAIHSWALDRDISASAGSGCNQIHINRGSSAEGCAPDQLRVCSDGTCNTGDCNEGAGESGAPDASCFEGNDIASYYDLSIWASSEEPEVPANAIQGITISELLE